MRRKSVASAKKKALFNSFIGLATQLILLALGFLVPRIILKNYGSDTNGFTNTVVQIFTYVALLEAGIGTATRNALYPLLQKKDEIGISNLMSISRRYFRKISLIYLAAVVVLSISLPFLLKSSLSFWTIFFYTLFEGLTAFIGFFFTSLPIVFLQASGNTFITNIISLVTKVLQYTIKIVLALLLVNILFIQVGYFAISLLSVLVYGLIMAKKYSWIDYSAKTDSEKLPDRNAYVINEVAQTIFSSTAMIVLSIFISTKMASVYSVYNLVYLSISVVIGAIFDSTKYLLGNYFHEDIEKYKKIHDLFNSVFLGLTIMCMCVAYWLILPFVSLYTKDVNDIDYNYVWLPLLFSFVNILTRMRTVPGGLTGIAGYAKPVSICSLIEAALNITLSLILVHFLGIYGVLIASVASLPIKVIFVNYLAEFKILKRNPFRTILIFSCNILLFLATMIINVFYKITFDSWIWFVVYGFILVAIYGIVVFVINFIINPSMRFYLKTRFRKANDR